MYDYYIILYYIYAGAVCAYVYVPTCMRTCMRADVRTHVHMRLWGCACARMCVRLMAGVRACARVRIYACMIIILSYYAGAVCADVYVCTCMRTYMRTCLQAHVRTRVRK